MKLLLLVALVLGLPFVAAALPGSCGSECVIVASVFPGYEPPGALVESGSSVTWRSVDVTHVTRDQTVGSPRPCFAVVGVRGEDAPAVRFDVVGAALKATVGGETTTCTGAVGSAEAGYSLPYFCSLHPFMRATLVVVPG